MTLIWRCSGLLHIADPFLFLSPSSFLAFPLPSSILPLTAPLRLSFIQPSIISLSPLYPILFLLSSIYFYSFSFHIPLSPFPFLCLPLPLSLALFLTISRTLACSGDSIRKCFDSAVSETAKVEIFVFQI